MPAQLVLVSQHAIEAAIEPVFFRNRKVAFQQLVHRAGQEPLPVNRKLTQRLTQTIDRQQLQHLFPRHVPALIAQLLLPEYVQPQLTPQMATEPAVAKTAGTKQPDVAHHQRQAIDLVGGDRPVIGKQSGLVRLTFVFIKDFDALAPSHLLTVVDLAQIKHLSLGRLSVGQAPRLDNAPIAVGFSILLAEMVAEEHHEQEIADCLPAIQDGRSALHVFAEQKPPWDYANAEKRRGNSGKRELVRRLG